MKCGVPILLDRYAGRPFGEEGLVPGEDFVRMAPNLVPPRNKVTEGRTDTAKLIRSQLVEAGKTFGLKLNGNHLWNELYLSLIHI